MSYGDVALGVECALPQGLDLAQTNLPNRGGGQAITGKEERDTTTALPARFGILWEIGCRRLCW